jgi:hypothetical protein
MMVGSYSACAAWSRLLGLNLFFMYSMHVALSWCTGFGTWVAFAIHLVTCCDLFSWNPDPAANADQEGLSYQPDWGRF